MLDKYQQSDERRIVLIGKTGTGKSTLGNAILGQNKFKTDGHPMESATVSCEVGKTIIENKNIVVLDTPGTMDTSREQEKIVEELLKCTAILAPGPHAFLLVVRADVRFTDEESKAVKIFCDFFGEEIYNHFIVVFTHKSALDRSNKTAEDCLLKLPEDFIKKYRQFNVCCIAIEAEGTKKHVKKEVKELLELVEVVVARNNGTFYTDEKMKEAEKAHRARISKIQEKVEEEFEQEKGKRPPEEIERSIRKAVQKKVIEDRDLAREEATNSKGFRDVARELITRSAGIVFDIATTQVTNVIGTLEGLLGYK